MRLCYTILHSTVISQMKTLTMSHLVSTKILHLVWCGTLRVRISTYLGPHIGRGVNRPHAIWRTPDSILSACYRIIYKYPYVLIGSSWPWWEQESAVCWSVALLLLFPGALELFSRAGGGKANTKTVWCKSCTSWEPFWGNTHATPIFFVRVQTMLQLQPLIVLLYLVDKDLPEEPRLRNTEIQMTGWGVALPPLTHSLIFPSFCLYICMCMRQIRVECSNLYRIFCGG